jgi:hypothetical protein
VEPAVHGAHDATHVAEVDECLTPFVGQDLLPDVIRADRAERSVIALVAAHFVAAALAPWLVRLLRRRAFLVLAPVPLAGLAWTVSRTAATAGSDTAVEVVGWVPSLGIELSFRMGALQWLMSLIVTGVGALVLFDCSWYFADDDPGLASFAPRRRSRWSPAPASTRWPTSTRHPCVVGRRRSPLLPRTVLPRPFPGCPSPPGSRTTGPNASSSTRPRAPRWLSSAPGVEGPSPGCCSAP